MAKNIFFLALTFLGGSFCIAQECSTNLSDCFKTTIPDLEAGDKRLQKYEGEVKKFLKKLKKNKKSDGYTFDNKSVLLKGWSVVDTAKHSDRYAVLLKDSSGKKNIFTWSENKSFDPGISKDCAKDEPIEFLTGEVYTSIEISNGVVVVGDCGTRKIFDAVKK